jgi:hypothetical protein
VLAQADFYVFAHTHNIYIYIYIYYNIYYNIHIILYFINMCVILLICTGGEGLLCACTGGLLCICIHISICTNADTARGGEGLFLALKRTHSIRSVCIGTYRYMYNA